jgi:hypothetical protein
VDNLILSLVSPGWRGITLWMWLPWLYEVLCVLFGLLFGALAVYCLSATGRPRLEALLARDHPPLALRRALQVLLAAFLVFFLALKTSQYVTFQGRNHVAMYLSMIWNTGKDSFLPNFMLGLKTQLGDHFEPIVALYWPIAHAFRSPWLTLMAHNLLVISCLWALWLLTRAWELPWPLPHLLLLLCATNGFFQADLSALLVPPPLAMPISLIILLAWERGHEALFAVSCALLLCVREEAAIALMALGAASLCVPGKRRLGFWAIVAGALAFGAENWAIRHWQEHVESKWARFFGRGDTAGGLFRFLIAHPWKAAAMWAWPPSRFVPFLSLLLSTGGLAVLHPPSLLALLVLNAPHQAASGGNAHFHSLELYYTSFLIPLLFWGSGRGLRELWTRVRDHRPFIVCALLLLIAKGTLSMTPHTYFHRLSPSRLRAGWSAILRVRPEESVWCAEAFAPSLAFRSRLKIIGQGDPRAPAFTPDVILVDQQEEQRQGPALRQDLDEAIRLGGLVLESQEEGVLFFRRPPRTAP